MADTQFAKYGDINLAYQVLGEGPVDLVWILGIGTNVELMWEEPHYAAFLRRLAEFARLILFDRRGAGLSDRTSATASPTLEDRAEDVLTVLDAVGSKQAAILGASEGGAVALMLAATHPDRISTLILYGSLVRFVSDAEHPYGVLRDAEAFERSLQAIVAIWGIEAGGEATTRLWAPSMVGDSRFEHWMTRNARQVLSRGAVEPFMRSLSDYDVAHLLPAIRVPTLVIHRTEDQMVPVACGRYIADKIPDARYIELPGSDHLPFAGDRESVVAEIEEFLTGTRSIQERDRRLLTVLFTDIVGSTDRAAEVGDRKWRELLDEHDAIVHARMEEFRGREVKSTGDGILAAFDGPARAIRGAVAVARDVGALGIQIKAGLHTGEVEVRGEDIGGIAVHTAARVMAAASPGEVLVSRTVRDLVAGSGIEFDDRGSYELKGVPGEWRLYAVQD